MEDEDDEVDRERKRPEPKDWTMLDAIMLDSGSGRGCLSCEAGG